MNLTRSLPMNEMETILLVDDSENDLILMSLAFKKAEFDRPLQMVAKALDRVDSLGVRCVHTC